jgi:predicted DsbA family dithiol-disulfide isomerase
VELDWRGYELRPDTPRGGMLMEQLFPGRTQAMSARMEQVARMYGVTGMRPRERLNNTRRVLGLAEWARDQGRLPAFREAAMAAYWTQGEDLESPEVLARLAEQAGLPAREALAVLDAPEYQARVDALRAEGLAAGVTGIPTAFIGPLRVVGAQPYEVYVEAVLRAGARPRS